MKKVILASAIALFGMVSAQESEAVGYLKGDTFVTGSVGYSNISQGDVETDNFTVAPSVGYFVSPNFALGVRGSYTYAKTSDIVLNTEVENKADTFSVGAFGRYYMTPTAKFSLFGEVNVDYANSNSRNYVAGNEVGSNKVDGFGAGISPGISYFIAKNFALEASYGILNYSSAKQDADGAVAVDNFQFGLDLNDLTIGLVYKF